MDRPRAQVRSQEVGKDEVRRLVSINRSISRYRKIPGRVWASARVITDDRFNDIATKDNRRAELVAVSRRDERARPRMPDGRRPAGFESNARPFAVCRFTPDRDVRPNERCEERGRRISSFVYVRDVNMSRVIRWPAIKWWV